ncbi:MAG: hypothetical protein IPH50_03300 [Rhodanobacteraceae bacterium]|nr:hypothetical protein [Rhodanobacteraceae bacterium]
MTGKQKNLDFRRWVLLGWLQFIWFLRKRCGIRAYGIGFMAARVKLPFDFLFRGARFCFYPPAARSYCLLPAGIANEPETHKFLARVLRGRKTSRLWMSGQASVNSLFRWRLTSALRQ